MSPSALRTRLRDVNVEFSSLLKNKSGEGRIVRMTELKSERATLMALLAGDTTLRLVTSRPHLML